VGRLILESRTVKTISWIFLLVTLLSAELCALSNEAVEIKAKEGTSSAPSTAGISLEKIGNLPRPRLEVTSNVQVIGRYGLRLLESIGWASDDFALFFERVLLSEDQKKALLVKRHYWMGQYYLERDEYVHAQGEFRAGLEIDPRSIPLRLALADALVANKQDSEAETLINEVLSEDPQNIKALNLLAQLYLSRAETSTNRKEQDRCLSLAAETLEKAKKIQPRNLDVLKQLVSVYTAKRDLDNLIKTYRDITQANPKDTYSLFVLANLLAKRGEREEAASLYEKVIEQRRSFVNAYVYLGLVQEEMGQTTQAIETYKRAILIEPRNVQLQRIFDALLLRATQNKGREAVLAEYEKFAQEYPFSTEVQRIFAEQLVKDHQTTRAIQQYERVLDLDPENVDALVAVASLLVEQGRYDEAGNYYARAMEVAPDRTDIYEAIANTFANVKDRAKAIQVLQRALRFNPNVPLLYVNIASLLEQDNRPEEAKKIIEEGLKKLGDKAEFFVALGEIAERQKNLEEALRYYRKACDLATNNKLLLARYLGLLAKAKRWDELESFAQEISSSVSDKADFFALVGETFLAEGELDRAAQWFEKAIAEAPDKLVYYGRLLQIYNVKNDHAKAFALIEKASKRAPDNPDIERMLADTYVDSKQYDKAIAIYKKFIEKEPTKLDGYRLLVDALNKAGRFEEALEVVKQAENAVGKNEETALLRAIALYNQKRYKAAETVLKDLLKGKTKNPDVIYYLLGSIAIEQKRYEVAESALKKAIEINPLNDSALNALGYMYADLGKNLTEAQSLIERALSINPQAPHILDSLGWVYYRKGNYESARELVEKAWHLMGDDPEILKHLGEIYFALGKKKEALDFWKRSLMIDDSQQDVKARIEEIERKLQSR